MTLKDTVRNCLMINPSIFENALDVYDHLFCVNGNGYEWENGELVKSTDKQDILGSKEDVVIQHLQYYLINRPNLMNRYIKNNIGDEFFKILIENIKKIFNVDNSIEDFTPMDIINNGQIKKYFEFYPLSEYSKMCCFPDDIKTDWFEGIKHMVEIMENNSDKLGNESEDKIWLEKIKEKIKNHRFNKN